MNKICLAIVLLLAGLDAFSQIKTVTGMYGIPMSYEFQLGDYLFSGDCFKGTYKLSCCTGMDEAETKNLYEYINTNMDSINKKFGINIVKVEITSTVQFLNNPPYEVSGGYAVRIVIVDTELRDRCLAAEKRERESRMNSLSNIL